MKVILRISLVILTAVFTSVFSLAEETTPSTTTAVSLPASATPATTSTATLPTVAPQTAPTFGMLLYTLGGVDDTQLKPSPSGSSLPPSYGIYDAYLSLSWKISKNIRVALLPTFGYNTAGRDYLDKEVTDKFYWRDFSFTVGQNNAFEDLLPANVDYKHKVRLYLPTSDGSKEEGMIARLRLELEAKYFLNQFSNVRAYVKPSYYFQRAAAFQDSRGNIKTSKMTESTHGVELNWNLNKTFSALPAFEIEDTWTNKSDENSKASRHTSQIAYRMGVEVRPSRDFNFIAGIQDKRDLIDPAVTPVTSYSILTNWLIF